MKFQAAMKTGTGLVTWRDLPRDKRYQMWFLSSSKPAESQAPRWLQIWKKMIESNVMNFWFTLSSNKNCEKNLGTKNLSQQGPPWFSATKRHRRLGFDGEDSSNKLPKCLEQVDGVPPPNGWNVLQHPAVRVPETWIRRLWDSLLNLLHNLACLSRDFWVWASCLPAQQVSSVFIRLPFSFIRKLLQPHQPPPQHLQPLPLIWTWKWVEGSLQVLERFFPPWVSLQTRQVLLQSTPDPVATFGTIPKKTKKWWNCVAKFCNWRLVGFLS